MVASAVELFNSFFFIFIQFVKVQTNFRFCSLVALLEKLKRWNVYRYEYLYHYIYSACTESWATVCFITGKRQREREAHTVPPGATPAGIRAIRERGRK